VGWRKTTSGNSGTRAAATNAGKTLLARGFALAINVLIGSMIDGLEEETFVRGKSSWAKGVNGVDERGGPRSGFSGIAGPDRRIGESVSQRLPI
jgi:hypothetical protein